MDAKLKAKWIAALRSGKYKQTSGNLNYGDGYCCLGVLGAVQGCTFDLDGTRLDGHYVGSSKYLQPNVFQLDYGAQHTLASMNDSGSTFTEIADYIEKNL